MKSQINNQLKIIQDSLLWISETESMKGAKGTIAYKKLVNYRRKLNRKLFAFESNPAAAMYGESQMGKSYLVGSLLSVKGQSFTVMDGHGESYDFINKINPIGKGTESTSLVTRFSTDYKWRNPDFPVKAKLLSPADLVLVLCDSYYNDVKAKIDIAMKSEAISEKIGNILLKFDESSIQQSLLEEDDVFDIQEYFISNFSTKATNVIHSVFFDKVSSYISKTNPSDWKDIFSLLWNKNQKITNLFSELIKQYEKLGFQNEVYLPIDAMLRDNGTLLDVARLHEIYGRYDGSEPNYHAESQVLIVENEKERVVRDFSKSYLCALTAELVFRLPKELESSKEFLKSTDLLDFPGARHRLGIHEEDIEDKIIPQMLLRGKVAYLFNKYSHSEKINILLFCHSDRMSAQSAMPEMLNTWISDMIGENPGDRKAFVDKSKVPPLFVVSTMFNLDLQFDFNNDREGNTNFLKNRWERRFLKVLEKEIFGSETFHWLKNWTTNHSNFQNIYLLRDFYYSSETNSKIFEGFNEFKTEKAEIVPATYPGFRKDLRQSFIEFDFVKHHFEDPAKSWDSAASINEDGTQLIIEKLSVAASNINDARHEKAIRELVSYKSEILEVLNEYYNSPEKTDSLLKAISIAGNIQAHLDIAFGRNPYFFGTMMKELMVSQSDIFSLFIDKIHDIERKDVKNMDIYSAIRMNIPELNPTQSFEVNLEYMRIHYEKQSLKECQHFFEDKNGEFGIDLNELFYGNAERVKNFSQILAEELEVFWFDHYMQENQKNLTDVFSETGLQNILDMLRRLFQKLQITKIIANKIRYYVDGYRNIQDVYEMIADISAEIINKFINSVGLEFFDDSNFNDLEKARQNINGLNWQHDELLFESNNKNEAAELITDMGNLPELLNQNPLPLRAKRLPNYRSYIIWYNLLKAGFVIASGVPDYDPVANEKLGKIISQCSTIQY